MILTDLRTIRFVTCRPAEVFLRCSGEGFPGYPLPEDFAAAAGRQLAMAILAGKIDQLVQLERSTKQAGGSAAADQDPRTPSTNREPDQLLACSGGDWVVSGRTGPGRLAGRPCWSEFYGAIHIVLLHDPGPSYQWVARRSATVLAAPASCLPSRWRDYVPLAELRVAPACRGEL